MGEVLEKGQNAQKKSFFEEAPGMKSNMRLMSFTALIAGIVFGLITILHPGASDNINGLWITFGFLIAAFAPKALQKFAETKLPPSSTEE